MLNYNNLPIILDGDIGDSIDSIIALCYLLKNNNINLKVITTNNENKSYDKIRTIKKILQLTGNDDIILGKGNINIMERSPYINLIDDISDDYILDSNILIHNFIKQSPCPVIIITIGSLDNIIKVLDINSSLSDKIHLISLFDNFTNKDKDMLEKDYQNTNNIYNKFINNNWKSITILPKHSGTISLFDCMHISGFYTSDDIYCQLLKEILPKNKKLNISSLLAVMLAIKDIKYDTYIKMIETLIPVNSSGDIDKSTIGLLIDLVIT